MRILPLVLCLLVTGLACAAPSGPAYESRSFVAGIAGRRTGFVHVEQKDGRWWGIDPLGRGFYFTGVQSANYSGVRDFLTHRCFYAENNRARYGTRAAWERDCLAKLTGWGFNMLGHGCETNLEHRGLVHAHELSMTQRLCRNPKDPDLAICVETTPSCSAFPNVFHPDFERYCFEFAQKHCAPYRDDPWVAGWYVDNELAWWGDREAHYRPRCNGLYETVARLPEQHSARRALAAFLAERGVKPGDAVPDELKRAFLLFAAERYFSVTARAVRSADPNHLLLGARFAGPGGAADPEVFAVAGRHADIVTFNCYPWVDLDTNEVLDRAGGTPITTVLGELAAQAKKPLMITEWSFPALDAGLPCAGGAGQRFATQDLRARASEIWMKTLLALPYVVGWNYFRWVDQPASGIARFNREDTNYGLVNERNEPYPLLVDAFARLQTNVLVHRTAPLPPKRVRTDAAVPPLRVLEAFDHPAQVIFRRVGSAYFVDVGGGFVCSGRIGGARMFEHLRLGTRELGTYGAMISLDREKGERSWLAANRVTQADWTELPGGRGALTVRAEVTEGKTRFAFTHRLTFLPGVAKFLCECLKVENLGTVPVRIDRIYFRLDPAFPVRQDGRWLSSPPVWKAARQAVWTSPSGLLLGAMTQADNVGVFRFYTDENGAPHPDMGFFPGTEPTLGAGKTWTPPRPVWILATLATTADGPLPPAPMFTPEQVKAIADEWDAKEAQSAQKRKPAPAAKKTTPAKPAQNARDLGNGMRVTWDAKGGFAFACGGRRLAFEPFVRTAAPQGAQPTVSFRTEGDAFVADIAGDARNFGELTFGRCSEKLRGLYFGYGYYVRDPWKFSLPLGGHQNACRYAGFDFTNGLSLVIATTTAPEALAHDPAKGSFGFRLLQPTRLTFVVGRKGAFDCALRLRVHDRTPPAAGFASKAGRFCVDSWNGTFVEFGDFIRRAADDYGLRDDLLFYTHCWQRYGFDRHLPDVYPPSKTFGTAAELKAAAAVARARGWRFGVHLNVIDCYTNSPWFGWEKICHLPNAKTGAWEPVKAWINPPHGEQSWRLLPKYGAASITYQMKQLLADGFRPDSVFIDVTGSGVFGAQTCRDRSGGVHTLIDNARENGRLFDVARGFCAPGGFVSSEAPCDYLNGHLDGGDCQWMFLTDEPGAYRWMKVPGSLHVKTPWFPLVHHDRIALHGAGYSARFEGARGEDCHGIDSDDYLSCELMNGHALMADCYNRDAYKAEAGLLEHLDVTRCLRQTVRKYWLAQHVVREIGTATVVRAAHVKGDPHHVQVQWSTGMNVFVNRGASDWPCATGDAGLGTVTLPQFGFVAFNPKTRRYAAIRRRGGRVVEESAYAEGRKVVRYVNPRGDDTARGRLPLAPSTQVLGTKAGPGETVRVKTTWAVQKGQSVPLGRFQVSYWLLDPFFREYSPKAAAVLVKTEVATLAWPMEVSFTWPKDVKGPRVLHVAVSPLGADVTQVEPRFKLLGTAAFYKRYRQGTFDAAGRYAAYACPDAALWERLFPPVESVDYGWIKTREAFRLVTEPGKPDRKTFLP